MDKPNKHGLPEMFRPLLWSYKFEEIDPKEHYGELVVNTVNLGSLKHWKWLVDFFGKDRLRRILEERLETEIFPESRNLARVMFGVQRFRHAPRSPY